MPDTFPRVFLNPGGDRRLAAGHPWAYSNEVRMDAAAKGLEPGGLVTLHRADGKPFGVATFNPHALIAARLVSRDPTAAIDARFVEARLRAALALRERLFPEPFYRLVHAEADGLPGLVIDRFGDVAVVQANTAGMERLSGAVLAALDAVLAPRAVVLRNDSRARAPEGLGEEIRLAKGTLDGPITVREGGLAFLADPLEGQKTGWFFDQRDNRTFVAALAAGTRVLDLYAHTGGFGLRAAAAGAAEVVCVDASEKALALAATAAERNGLAGRIAVRKADVFEEAERLAEGGARFEVVIADPPAFVRSRKELATGAKGYRKLARLAARLVAPKGFLFIASCSHNMEADLFAAEVATGLGRAGREGRILRAAGAAPDHPIHPHLPESAYLKTLTLQLD
jgi:23S rRNA (cytosine1962-C5)-methyltransferase